MKQKTKTARKAAKSANPPKVRPLVHQALQPRIAVLEQVLAQGEHDRHVFADAVLAMTRTAMAAESLSKSILRFETAEYRSIALLSTSCDGIERSQRIELRKGEEQKIDLPVTANGRVDIQLVNMGREFCFMTEAVYCGRVFSKGNFVHASIEGVVGALLQVKVERP